MCSYELLLKVENEELKAEIVNPEGSNDILLCESHQIYIKSCQDATPKAIDKITYLQQVATKLLSNSTDGFKHFDFTLNKQGIVCTSPLDP